jgi:hypothetical protein
MNDLDLIKGFRSRVNDPDPERVQAAWANVLQRLREPPAPPGSQPVRSRNRWVVPAGIAAGAVALAVALPTILPGGSPGGPGSAEAARVLRRIAVVAADQPAQAAPAVGQYVYTKTKAVQTSRYVYLPGGQADFSFILPETREAWIGPDGSGRILSTYGEVSFPSPQDRAAWVAAGSPDLVGGKTSDETFGPGELHFLDLSGLPTDPEKLQALIEGREIVGGPPGDWETFAIIGDLLRETHAPPALRAALYEVAANLSGVEYIGEVKDALSRPGLAVASTHDGIRRAMIFDPETAQLLGETEVLVDPEELTVEVGPDTHPRTILYGPGAPGTVLYSAVYLASGIVESTTTTPEEQG